jgi:cation transport ATPase
MELSLGGVVAADVKLVEGSILLDQSMLTGESVLIEAGPGPQTYAGALARRGEATATVTATGARTKFGHTAQLVRTAHVESTQQKNTCASGAKSCRIQFCICFYQFRIAWLAIFQCAAMCGSFSFVMIAISSGNIQGEMDTI